MANAKVIYIKLPLITDNNDDLFEEKYAYMDG
jgi:hypothetical protein